MLTEDTILKPIVFIFCEKFVTYIEFDLVLHLHEIHKLRRGYLDTPPTPYTPSRSWLSDSRTRKAITYGEVLGHNLDEDSLKELDQKYHQYQRNASQEMQEPIPTKVYDHDKPYSALKNHTLEQSPCLPIISVRGIMYYCEICHPEHANDSAVASIHLSSVEHHCRYRDPEKHRAEILTRLGERK